MYEYNNNTSQWQIHNTEAFQNKEDAGTAQEIIDSLNFGDIITHDASEFQEKLAENENTVSNQQLSNIDLIPQINSDIQEHVADDSNPHGVTKIQIGLPNVDNTSDLDKPISTVVNTELNNRVLKTAIKQTAGDSTTDLISQKGITDLVNNEVAALEAKINSFVVNIRDFGAKGDGITDDTAAIQAAYEATKNTDPFFFAEKGALYFPAGTYLNTGILISTNIKIYGDGMATRLVNTSPSSNLITIEGGINSVGIIEISDLRLSGTGTGSIININKYIKTIIRNVHIYGSGGYGISFGQTDHVGVIDIVNCRILLCQNSAIYGRSKDTVQINAINIESTYISYNKSHGIDVFGNVLNILNSTIEANQGVGINIDSSDFATESYRISNINIDKNYIENNKGGNISIVGGRYAGNITKVIRHLNISNNYIYSGALNIDGSTPTNKNVSFSRRGDNTNINFYLNDVINTMTWKNNNVFNQNPLLNIIDFDNALSDTCIIWMDGLDAYNWIAATVEDPRKPKYINLGRAKFISTQTLVLSGTSFAKSSEITYSSVSARKSDAITTNEVYKYVEFPIPLPSNSIIVDITIPVYVTDTNKAFDLSVDLYSASILSDVNTLKNHIVRSGVIHNSLTRPYISRSYFPEEIIYNVVGADIDLLRSGYGKEE